MIQEKRLFDITGLSKPTRGLHLAGVASAALLLAACGGQEGEQAAQAPAAASADTAAAGPVYDLIVANGMVYDGFGGAPVDADVAVKDDRVVYVGDLSDASAKTTIDTAGKAVAPGFINVLSWATESLIEDPRSQSDIRQGVTLEVMGEGWTMGPVNDAMKKLTEAQQSDVKYDVEWTSFGGYMNYLENRGISTNIASFVGATTLRIHEIGYDDRPPTDEELGRMQDLVRDAMGEGALGVGSSLIYPPAFYADTDELVALVSAAAESGGGYITHMRSEGDRFFEGIDETIDIARRAGAWAQIYHFKPAGKDNWDKRAEGIAKLEAARAEGLDLSANMYTYTAGATGLGASMSPAVQEGGHDAWVERLKDPEVRARVVAEMTKPGDGWENLYYMAGDPSKVLLIGFKSEALKPLTGKSVAEVAKMRGTSPEETVVDLVIEDDSRVGTAYFLMSEENVVENIKWPYMMFGSDAESLAPEGVFLKSNPHPRAYGNFARLLGKYVREERVIPLEEAIRRLTSLSAKQLRIEDRGCLKPDCFADIVVFDPEKIADKSAFADPHQYSVGVSDVVVNGVQVLAGGVHTDATPGRFVKGPGYKGSNDQSTD